MKTTTRLAALAASLFALAAHAAPAPTMDELYEQAKQVKTISFAGTLREDGIKKVLAVFQERYPGLEVSYQRRATGPLIQLLEAQRRAGRANFDLVNLSEPDAFLRWREQDYVAKVAVPEIADMLPNTYDDQGYYFAVAVTPMPGIYSERKLKPEQAPTSLKQLVQPEWKGSVAISRPTRGGVNAASLMNVAEANGPDFIQKMVPNMDILLTNGNEVAINSVVSGERLVSWGVTGYRAALAIADGAPVKLIWWKEGVALAQYPTGVLTQAKNPAGAQLLLRWLLSPEGQSLVVRNLNVHASRPDVTDLPAGLPALKDIPLNAISAERVRDEGSKLVDEFEHVMGLK